MVRGSEPHLHLHEGPLEDFGWQVHVVVVVGCVIVCLLFNLLATHELKRIRGRKRKRKGRHRQFW